MRSSNYSWTNRKRYTKAIKKNSGKRHRLEAETAPAARKPVDQSTQSGEKLPELVINPFRAGDGIGNLHSQKFTISPSQALHLQFNRPFAHSQPLPYLTIGGGDLFAAEKDLELSKNISVSNCKKLGFKPIQHLL